MRWSQMTYMTSSERAFVRVQAAISEPSFRPLDDL